MSLGRFGFRVLVLALGPIVSVSACGGAAGTSVGRGPENPTVAQGSSTLIVRAQLAQLAGQSAYDAVETLNRRWILPRRGASLASGQAFARVVVDGVARGELSELAGMNTDNIETMRYLSAPDATTRYGTGFPGGVIEVTTRRN